MKNLKRLFSLILGICTLFTSIPNAFAGGINGEEILKDGTKIIFVSSDKIPEKLDYYEQKCQELLNKRYSTKQNLAIRSASIALAGTGFYISSTFDYMFPSLAICGKVMSVLIGLMGFFYPDYHDRKYAKEYLGTDERPGYSYDFGYKMEKPIGLEDITRILRNAKNSPESICILGESDPNQNRKDMENGIAIVIRPGPSNRYPGSGVYIQNSVEFNSVHDNLYSKFS